VGEGGIGRAYCARDTQLGRTVATKIMSPTLAVDPNRLHRFEQDARAAAALNHPGVLAIETWCRPVAPRCSFPHLVPVISAGRTVPAEQARAALSVLSSIDVGAARASPGAAQLAGEVGTRPPQSADRRRSP